MRTLDLGPETAVIYTRLSQDRDGTGLAVERQETESRDLARRLGLEVTRVYSDNDFSATNGKVRPEFERMLADEPPAIVTWHQDRLLRLTSDLERVIALNIPVYTATAGTLDLATPAGRAVARTVAAWSTYEGEQKALRQQAANRQRAERGNWQFSRRPFGYDRIGGEVIVIEREAEVVREAFQRYAAGDSFYALAKDWNERGIRTPDRIKKTPDPATGEMVETVVPGAQWTMTQVRRIVTNGHYAGLLAHKGESIEGTAGWPAIVTEDVFYACQDVREDRSREGAWSRANKHLLSNVVRCGVCGGRMLARPDRRRMVYACCTRWCVSRGVEDVDGLVEAVVLARLADKEIVKRLRKRPDTAPLTEELADLRKRRDAVADLVADGLITKRKAREQLQELAERIDRAQSRLRSLRSKSPLSDIALARDIPRRWANLPVLDKRRIIAELGLVVEVLKAKPGRRPFDPATVRFTWEDMADAR